MFVIFKDDEYADYNRGLDNLCNAFTAVEVFCLKDYF